MGGGQCLPLVGVDADAEESLPRLLGALPQGAIAGYAAGAEDDVGALVERLACGRSAPVGR